MTEKQIKLLNDYFIKINDNKYYCLLNNHNNSSYTLKECIKIIDSL